MEDGHQSAPNKRVRICVPPALAAPSPPGHPRAQPCPLTGAYRAPSPPARLPETPALPPGNPCTPRLPRIPSPSLS